MKYTIDDGLVNPDPAATLALAGLFVLGGCRDGEPRPEDPRPLDPALHAALAAWLDSAGVTPERYVVGLFAEHDVVFLGEQHRVKHDLLLVQSLLRPLYDAGVRVLATGFARREDQPLLDSLLAAPEWDEGLAREIVFRQSVLWGYREYVDVFRSAWTVNRERPAGAPPFRILGINDSPDWSLITTQEDLGDPAIMRQVWRGGGEEQWAEVILASVRAGEKVLVHSGIHHAFTEYRQPIVVDGAFRRFDPNPASRRASARPATKPISEYEGVTPIPDWINEDNLVRARARSPNPAFRRASIRRFNATIARDAEIGRRRGHLR